MFLGSTVGYKKNEAEQDYIAPKADKKKKDKGNKPQGTSVTTNKVFYDIFLFI